MYEHLTPGSGATHAAKNIRAHLKKLYPGGKFSVKTDHFANGNSVSVRWTDGPVQKAVDEALSGFVAGRFDGMQDIYDYKESAFGREFGTCKYLHTRRNCSDALVQKAIDAAVEKYGTWRGEQERRPPSLAEYRAGILTDCSPISNWQGCWWDSWQGIIDTALVETAG